MTMTGQQNAPRFEGYGASTDLNNEMPQATIPPARLGSSGPYCNCPRTGDLWRCPVGGTSTCDPFSGACCALYATTLATGRETWDRAAEDALDGRPCPCGEADR